MAFLIRDQFSDADIDPLVDSSANPGPGTRDVTGALWKIINATLRGGPQSSSPTWGNSKIVYDGQTRADGLTLWALVKPSDKDTEQGFGWATSTAITNPETDGHHWVNDTGYPRVSTPGKLVTLSNFPDNGKIGAIRPVEYLVGVTLRAQGAFYWISAAAPQTRTGVNNSNDYPGIPQYPQARVLWVDDAATTTPMYPEMNARTGVGPNHDNLYDDVRAMVITDWASDAGMATFLDRFTRADSATTLGGSFTAHIGTWGISSNKAYNVSGAAGSLATAPSGLTGDGIWRCKITIPTTPTNDWAFVLRYVDTTNFIMLGNAGVANSLRLYKCVAGSFTMITNTSPTLTAGATYDLTVITSGNQYQVYLDGTLQWDWISDGAGSTFLTGSRIGMRAGTTGAAGMRWDDIMAIPSTLTLPTDIQVGSAPHIFTVGSSIATDNFTAADGTTLNGRTTTTGGKTWTADSGYQITSNQAVNTNTNSAGDTPFFATIDAGATDYQVSVDIKGPGVDDYLMKGFVVRWVDANNHIYIRQRMGSDQPSNDEIEINECVAGTYLGVTKGQFGDYYALNTVKNLTVQLVGRVMHVFLGGELVITYIVSAALTGTRVGLYHSNRDDGSTFDTFALNALTDPAAGGPAAVLAGNIAAGSAVTASQLSLNHAVAANVAASSAMTATRLTMNHALAAGIAAGSAATADKITVSHPMSAAIAATSGGVADLTVNGSGASLAATMVIGSAVTAPGLTILHPLAAGIVIGSAGAATKITVNHPLIATVTAGSSMTANRVTVNHALQAAIAASLTMTGGFALPFYGEFTGRAKMIPAWDGAATFD